MSRSTTSAETKHGMDADTWATPAMTAAMSMPFPDIAAAATATDGGGSPRRRRGALTAPDGW